MLAGYDIYFEKYTMITVYVKNEKKMDNNFVLFLYIMYIIQFFLYTEI